MSEERYWSITHRPGFGCWMKRLDQRRREEGFTGRVPQFEDAPYLPLTKYMKRKISNLFQKTRRSLAHHASFEFQIVTLLYYGFPDNIPSYGAG